MKQLFFLCLVALTFTACKKDSKAVDAKDVDGTEVSTTEGTTVAVNNDNATSYVQWTGSKVLGDSHTGKIFFDESNFVVKDGKLVGGELTIDMNSMTSEDGAGDKLLGHLKNSDFFETDKYGKASFKIIGSEALEAADEDGNTHMVEGTMTIKNTSKVIKVPAKVSVNGNSVSLQSNFLLNRADFDVQYGSTKFNLDLAKDRVIKDDIELGVNVSS